MMKPTPKDYTHRTWIAALGLIALLVAISFIPPQQVGGVTLRRANILSELLTFDNEPSDATAAEPALDEEDVAIDLAEIAELIVADTLPQAAQTRFVWQVDTLRVAPLAATESYPVHADTPIETLDSLSTVTFEAFCDTLLTAERPVRIAFLGDSFIEGDILTADLRERLQCRYGGGGTGFAPMASPLTAFRRSVKTQSKGWTPYNIMQYKRAPESVAPRFYVSGWVCTAADDASTRWETTSFRSRLATCHTAHVLFTAEQDSRIEMILNDSLRYTFAVEGDPAVRDIVVENAPIANLTFHVLEGAAGLTGYGAIFDDGGISVDNYSVRSNNGQALFWTNPTLNAQINALLRYDLVILQYGLNIMQQGVYNYHRYGEQLQKMVAYVRECFPGAAILLVGVSDRSTKTERGFEPMDALPYMIDCQRNAARVAGASFWPTAEAMQRMGGMESFVQNGWAGKDYTHINYGGGAQVANCLADAIAERVEQQRLRLQRRAAEQAIVDSLQRVALERSLLPVTPPAIIDTLQSLPTLDSLDLRPQPEPVSEPESEPVEPTEPQPFKPAAR